MDVPVVETLRLRLRAHTPADLPDSLRMWQDPGVTRFIGGRPLTEEEVWLRLLRYWGGWAALGFGFWRLETRDGAFVGEVGFQDLRRDTTPSFAGEVEAGWGLLPCWHGQGLAREAVEAMLAWRDRAIANPRTVCIINPENGPSLTLAAKVGFVADRTVAHRAGTWQLFTRTRT